MSHIRHEALGLALGILSGKWLQSKDPLDRLRFVSVIYEVKGPTITNLLGRPARGSQDPPSNTPEPSSFLSTPTWEPLLSKWDSTIPKPANAWG